MEEMPTSTYIEWKQWEILSKVQESNDGKDHLLSDKQHNSSSLSVEGGRNSLQNVEWSCKETPVQMSQKWGNGMSRIRKGCDNPVGRCQIQWKESSGVELGYPSSHRLFR